MFRQITVWYDAHTDSLWEYNPQAQLYTFRGSLFNEHRLLCDFAPGALTLLGAL